ncbi:MAG: sigma-E factor negative regulatory protein [Rhodocyclaceae bacterium]
MNDKVSALLDGDLDDHACARLLDGMRTDPSLRRQWDAYCLIGDALRGEHAQAGDFAARVMAGLDSEPTVLAPAVSVQARERRGLARALMPVAASVMGVLAVGWVAFTLSSQPQTGVPMASVAPRMTPEPMPVTARANPTETRDDAHREFVFVHQAMSGGGPIPGVVQYVRTVSDNRGDVRR